MEAIRNGVKGVFSDADWKTGQPQRYGWQEIGKEKKELPKEIINFIQRRRPEKTVQDELDELSKPDFATGGIVTGGKVELEGGETVIPSPPTKVRELEEKQLKKILSEAGEKSAKKVKPKKEKHDNPKQKVRGTAKRNHGRVAKN